MATETFSVRWQVAHSKVRISTPRSPGEIRANPILCLQTGHIGRSAMELELRITRITRRNDIRVSLRQSVRWPTLGRILGKVL
jgi:hypothetical protein